MFQMIDSDICNALRSQNFKEIEDIIDARKQLGQYNVYKHPNSLNIRCVYSSLRGNSPEKNRTVKFDEPSLVSNDKELLIAEFSSVKHTDSEITIVRVKCNGAVFKGKLNRWDMNDIAIPGDGTHLGESPSLVNLATLVTQNVQCEGDDEYLVPLSSWDPFIKNEDFQPDMKCCSDSKINEKYLIRNSYTDPNINSKIEESSSNSQTDVNYEEITLKGRRASWAGKISKFWRKHWRRTKSLSGPEVTEENYEYGNQDKN